MSGNLQALARKIASAGDLEGVVRSMKALAASSIGQYEKAVESLDDYYRTVELGLSACLREGNPAPVTADQKAAVCKIGAVIFGSDQGLVGGFNEVLMESAQNVLRKLPGKTKKMWAVGERIQSLMTDIDPSLVVVLSVPASVNGITPLVGQILVEIEAALEQGKIDEVYVFHNRPKAGAIYEPVNRRLLPLDRTWEAAFARLPWPTKNLPQVIGGNVPTLQALIREYLFVLLFQACAESLASENASRLAAMQRAEKNIEEILEDLNGKFHRIRQESIDEELFDVISGYEALSKKSTVSSDRAIDTGTRRT
ncbi:F0F1 ATP synthase subunit gamma [Rhodanobacter sp. MP7CTX1]|uniref:F0F1 ATP synthase subunit gamma n=1 Tax=Rhodanobacter sp. MP7CTX1 TaxID=2723084 RepID=UPI001609F683|nr:F0F1 ATP synthase subunit gamma [Rhodanobacter sp. MP7CTX1]MBB6185983.1 F-type H+-transporting ATPase subunit gamma [Rhodanobacter sp. MP7CTX1]